MAVQADLSLTWLKTPKTGFLVKRFICKALSVIYTVNLFFVAINFHVVVLGDSFGSKFTLFPSANIIKPVDHWSCNAHLRSCFILSDLGQSSKNDLDL